MLEKKKKKEMEVVESAETSFDEGIVDIYLSGDATGYRIPTKGFDFSCLGEEKGMLAGKNLDRLIGILRSVAPNAEFIDDYRAVMPVLSNVWEIEHRRESHGIQRSLFGGVGFSKVALSNNLGQFTKYSRLQQLLYEK